MSDLRPDAHENVRELIHRIAREHYVVRQVVRRGRLLLIFYGAKREHFLELWDELSGDCFGTDTVYDTWPYYDLEGIADRLVRGETVTLSGCGARTAYWSVAKEYWDG